MEKLKKVCIPDQSFADRTAHCAFLHFSRNIMRNQYVCRECHGNFDPGELVQGWCPECFEKLAQREMNRQEADRTANVTHFKQMEMEEMLYECN